MSLGMGKKRQRRRRDLVGYRFEVLEAKQRKVLRLRARHLPATAQTAPR
jgi:hypothetical protein